MLGYFMQKTDFSRQIYEILFIWQLIDYVSEYNILVRLEGYFGKDRRNLDVKCDVILERLTFWIIHKCIQKVTIKSDGNT